MTIDNKIRDGKLQFDTNREATKTSALPSRKIFKYEYPTVDQRRVIEQAKFTYSPLGKVFQKQGKKIEDQVIKQAQTLKALKPEENQELE